MFEILTAIGGAISFLIFFNRNPKRLTPHGSNLMISPADGYAKDTIKVKSVQDLFGIRKKSLKKLDGQGKLVAIPINLSIMNVHITRSPCNAVIEDVIHQKGRYIPAIFKESLFHNQKKIIVMKAKGMRFAVIQSSGIFARRLRCWVRAGDSVFAGQCIGRILLGSNTMLIAPERKLQILVRPEQIVRGGETILGVSDA